MPVWKALGHVSPLPQAVNSLIGMEIANVRFARNSFGKHFAAAGFHWNEWLCREDSDGDGLSNGEELGDPHCVWRPGMPPTRNTTLSHPALAGAHGEWTHLMRHAARLRCRVGVGCETMGIGASDKMQERETPPAWEVAYYHYYVCRRCCCSGCSRSSACRPLRRRAGRLSSSRSTSCATSASSSGATAGRRTTPSSRRARSSGCSPSSPRGACRARPRTGPFCTGCTTASATRACWTCRRRARRTTCSTGTTGGSPRRCTTFSCRRRPTATRSSPTSSPTPRCRASARRSARPSPATLPSSRPSCSATRPPRSRASGGGARRCAAPRARRPSRRGSSLAGTFGCRARSASSACSWSSTPCTCGATAPSTTR